MIETLDMLGDLVLRQPWHSVAIVIALNVAVIGLWITFEKCRERDARRHSANPNDEKMR